MLQPLFSLLIAGSFCWFVASSLWIYPHSLSYFNESIGGPLNGPEHLLGSNVDWGQDLLSMFHRAKDNPEDSVLIVGNPLNFPYKTGGPAIRVIYSLSPSYKVPDEFLSPNEVSGIYFCSNVLMRLKHEQSKSSYMSFVASCIEMPRPNYSFYHFRYAFTEENLQHFVRASYVRK